MTSPWKRSAPSSKAISRRYPRAAEDPGDRRCSALHAQEKHPPSFTPCGTFAPKRSIETLVDHNGIVQGDIDHLNDPTILAETKRQICADPYTVYCFVSPGGQGLKFGLHISPVTNNDSYKHAGKLQRNTICGSTTCTGTRRRRILPDCVLSAGIKTSTPMLKLTSSQRQRMRHLSPASPSVTPSAPLPMSDVRFMLT